MVLYNFFALMVFSLSLSFSAGAMDNQPLILSVVNAKSPFTKEELNTLSAIKINDALSAKQADALQTLGANQQPNEDQVATLKDMLKVLRENSINVDSGQYTADQICFFCCIHNRECTCQDQDRWLDAILNAMEQFKIE